MNSVSTASEMTVEHLGQEATEADLNEFRVLVRSLMDRDGLDEQDATDVLWGSGDYLANATRLGLMDIE